MANITVSYETFLVLNPSIGEDGTNAILTKIKDLISANGTLESVDEWGKRRLAYAIDDEAEGIYYLINFTSSPEFPAELERIYNITEGILRTLVIKK